MRFWMSLLTFALVVACAPAGPSYREARRDLIENRPEDAAAKLEQLAQEHPDNSEIHLDLGEAYFKTARKALDEGNDVVYLNYLAKAQGAVIRAAELDPSAPGPHTWMGIIAAYQSDLDRTLINLQNAKRLEPYSPVAYTNLAETYVYMGKISIARRNLKKARKLGSPPVSKSWLNSISPNAECRKTVGSKCACRRPARSIFGSTRYPRSGVKRSCYVSSIRAPPKWVSKRLGSKKFSSNC